MTWISGYAEPIGSAFFYFLAAALVLAIPYLAWQYRRWGALDPARVWAQASWLLYLTCAWALVLMPFPEDSCARDVSPQLEPFNWLALARAQSGDGYALLANPNVVMFIFNIALLFPFGVYLRRWFGRGVITTVLLGFALSLTFEVTQLTANFGIYPCTYRQFNIDDLMANTTGALLGWLLAPLIVFIPRRGAPTEPDRGVTVPRRALSLLIDYIGALLVALAWSTVSETYSLPLPGAPLAWTLFAMTWAVPLITGGRTPGQFAVGIRMESKTGYRRNPLRLLVRWALVWGPYPAVLAFMRAAGTNPTTAALVAVVLLGLWLLLLLTTRLHETLSRTRTVVDQRASRKAATSVGSVGKM
ncbi:MAG: VanZ family protein [Candidatus Nanopelagicales bacterium]